MDAETRRIVRSRANRCCEYCGLSQEAVPFYSFHIEHIIARQHSGTDDPANLALACQSCNYHKGPNIAGSIQRAGFCNRFSILALRFGTSISVVLTLLLSALLLAVAQPSAFWP
jgi:hypothetical protein